MYNEQETEDDTTLTTLTSTTKVLAIGDPKEVVSRRKAKPVTIENSFSVDCTNYLSLVLMGNPAPVDDVSGLCPIEWFGMVTFAFENQPTRYQFYCYPAQKTKPRHTYLNYFYQTINANAVLRDVRRFLKEENWISKNAIVGPLKGDVYRNAYKPEEFYILGFVFKALNIQRAKVLPYLMYLHREHAHNTQHR
ncbi:uncharacterized protein Dmoj_GI26542 [Drosophila mojavensis]|uniref:Uncharacterized protein n=2 Tax=Drosophila mojavensis TaxID=7230 RepID=A0A0Q9XKX7_DROMO|nr:uncharacterized protein Dmoj_GI26542 [Drosophila mojavensis]